jgi:hypothetical protein
MSRARKQAVLLFLILRRPLRVIDHDRHKFLAQFLQPERPAK